MSLSCDFYGFFSGCIVLTFFTSFLSIFISSFPTFVASMAPDASTRGISVGFFVFVQIPLLPSTSLFVLLCMSSLCASFVRLFLDAFIFPLTLLLSFMPYFGGFISFPTFYRIFSIFVFASHAFLTVPMRCLLSSISSVSSEFFCFGAASVAVVNATEHLMRSGIWRLANL